MPQASPLSQALLWFSVAMVAASWLLALRAIGRGTDDRARTIVLGMALLIVWAGLWLGIGRSGILAQFDSMPPRPFFMLLAITVGTFALAYSPWGKSIALNVPIAGLLGFQAFRIPVELMLWQVYRDGVIGRQMTFEGLNFDVVSGVLGLALGLAAFRRELPRAVLWAYNVLGLGLLLNILVVAVLSMPTPFRQFTEGPANTFVASAPFVLLPAILVFAALFGHVMLFRRLTVTGTRSPHLTT